MGRSPCCSKLGLKRGPWSIQEDTLLTNYIHKHGQGHWRSLPHNAGLLRCGKSCRLRWMNYLRPGIKRGNTTQDEEDLILRLHTLLGNRWSLIAGRLPGRTDNEIKNYWNTHLVKKLKVAGSLPTHRPADETTKTAIEDASKPKPYFPKATTVSSTPVFPATEISESLSIGLSPSSSGGGAAAEVEWPALFEEEQWDYCGGREEDELLCAEFYSPPLTVTVLRRSESICSDDVDKLNKVYDEYLQLL